MINLIALMQLNSVRATQPLNAVSEVGIVEKIKPKKLAKPIEAPKQEPIAEAEVINPEPVKPAVAPVYASGGYNGYTAGNCTWYAKDKRPDLPNDLGNANTWFYRASVIYGMATGTEPRVGAIGTTTAGYLGHVVYVEAVNGDGTIQISEMNAVGYGVISYRSAYASEFLYIY